MRQTRVRVGSSVTLVLLSLCAAVPGANTARAGNLGTYDVEFAKKTGYIQWNFSDNVGEWFERYPGNPLAIPQYMAQGVVHPDILYFPNGEDGYRFWLYYTPYPPESRENPCLVRSNDGVHFTDTVVVNPMITRSEPWEQRHLADEDVIKVGDTWYMYYVGRNFDSVASIGVATSTDGKHWSKYAGNPIIVPTQGWENKWVGAPTVYHDGQRFWMWFCGGYTMGIELASSADGLTWTREYNGFPVLMGTQGAWDGWGVSHPNVINYKDTLWMYYWGYSGSVTYRLGLAKSVDRIHWVKDGYNVVLDTVQHSWEGTYIYRASPAIVNDTMFLYYSAYDDLGTVVPRIGLALSHPPKDGDADGDGSVDISDAVYLISYLYSDGPAPKRPMFSDDNCNGVVDLADVVYVLNFIFQGGPQPRSICR